MRTILVIFLSLSLMSVQAQDIYQNDINTLLYVKGTFGGHSSPLQDNSLKLGFTLSQTSTILGKMENYDLFSDLSSQNNLIDIEFSSKTNYFSNFRIGGVDALKYKTVMHVDGTGSEYPYGLSGGQIILGGIMATGFGFLIYTILDDDEDVAAVPQQPPQQSDLRLKKDINYLVTLQNGIKLYSFRYKHDDATTYVGVMAQDLLKHETYREAVIMTETGFYAVHYEMLGLKMITLDEWQISQNNIYSDQNLVAYTY